MGLEGKTVLVTRTEDQSQELRSLLSRFGAETLTIPTIEIDDPLSWAGADEAIGQISAYDWIVFASGNAAERFVGRAGAAIERFAGKVAAVGPQTARRLVKLGMTVELIPGNFRADALLESLPGNLTGVRILLPQGEIGNESLPGELSARGASVDVVGVYRNRLPRAGRDRLRQLLEESAIDCITLTSGSTAENLIRMIGTPNPLDLFAHPAIAVIGPVTRAAAEGLGLRVDIEPPSATIPSMVEAIRNYFDRK